MKNIFLCGLIIILAGLIVLGAGSQNLIAYAKEQEHRIRQSAGDQQAAPTLIPTISPSVVEVETPEARVLPPVGSNAGLVIGASVLVLIIIGGVLSAQRKPKH
jgi:hypothetical protein